MLRTGHFSIDTQKGKGIVDVLIGNSAEAPFASSEVDFLVVPVYPESHAPTDPVISKFLGDCGVSLPELAERKALDLLTPFGCWISEEVNFCLGMDRKPFFKRILCIETFWQAVPSDLIHDIFYTLSVFLKASELRPSLFMPVAGVQESTAGSVTSALAGAAAYWIGRGAPLSKVEFFVDEAIVDRGFLEKKFQQDTQRTELLLQSPAEEYDLFISYSKANQKQAILLYNELSRLLPNLKMFLGKREALLGPAGQGSLFGALENSRACLFLLCPHFFKSSLCQKELYIAHHRQQKGETHCTFIQIGGVELPPWIESEKVLEESQLGTSSLNQRRLMELLPAIFSTENPKKSVESPVCEH